MPHIHSKFALRLAALFVLFNLVPAVGFAGFSVIPAPPVKHQFTFEIRPGEERKGTLLVENFGPEGVNLSLYGADGTQSDQGTFALTSKSHEQKHLGTWIKISQDSTYLPAKQRKEIPFTVKVPKEATPGTYSGGIAAESGGSAIEGEGKTSAVSITSRFVVKVFVKVPGEKIHKYDWTDFSFNPATQNNGIVTTPSFSLSYRNLGNTMIKTEQKITVTGFPGLPKTLEVGKIEPLTDPDAMLQTQNGSRSTAPDQNALVFRPQQAIVLQNSQTDIPVKWTNPPEFGFFKATATVTFYEYDIITGKNLAPRTETRTITFCIPLKFSSPLHIAFLLGALAILGFISYFIYAHFRLKKLIKTSEPHTVAAGETLAEIADDCGTGWKLIAKINKIKPPYTIKTGQKIIVPTKKNDKKK